MKFGLIIFTCLFCFSITSRSQLKYGIRRIDAFFTERIPGNIRADQADNIGESGFHGRDTTTTIYIETRTSHIKWIAVWKDGKSFSVSSAPVNERPFEVGVNKFNNEKIILRPRKGNKLWLLQLEKKQTSSKPPVKAKKRRNHSAGHVRRKVVHTTDQFRD